MFLRSYGSLCVSAKFGFELEVLYTPVNGNDLIIFIKKRFYALEVSFLQDLLVLRSTLRGYAYRKTNVLQFEMCPCVENVMF